ncbi:MAG: SGNH/GDSL hydrolase family protein, partial [Thermoanaerobaculia bacterium]
VKIGHEFDLFNTINREETKRACARYADVTPGSLNAATDATLVAPDGLHPSAAMYAQWVKVISPQAEAALGH